MTRKAGVVRAGTGKVLSGPGQQDSFILSADDTDGLLEWFSSTVGYAAGPPYHIHHQADEVVMVLEGELKIKLDGDLLDVRPGDVVFIPRGVPHTFTNIHPDQPAHMVGIYTPAGLQEFLGMWSEMFGEGQPDETAMAELAARYGQEPAGPPLAVELGLPEVVR